MTMTDPIADMLTRLRNANSAYHDTVGMPYSKIKSHIAEILQQEGYIAGWRVEDAEVGKNLVITLKFGNQRERSIAGIKRVSKPGLRVYAKKDNLPKVLGGLGVAIISTSGGLMTDRQAKKSGVGGEVLAYVWERGEALSMSRIGRLPIPVPAGVDITIDGRNVQVKGPKGTLTHTVAEPIEVSVYAKKDNLPKVLGGLGVAIISTSGGLLTDKQAKKRGVGGEVLAYVW